MPVSSILQEDGLDREEVVSMEILGSGEHVAQTGNDHSH